jgi:hypothetical protein
VLKNRSVSVSESLEQEGSLGHGSDVASQKSESSPISTPQTSKRKSIQGRKLRPKSVVDEDSGTPDLLNTSLMTSTPNTSSAFNGGGNNSEIVDTVPDLPTVSVLNHLGKARPKRPKKHAPTRGQVLSRPNESSTYVTEVSFDEGMDRYVSICSKRARNNSFCAHETSRDALLLKNIF